MGVTFSLSRRILGSKYIQVHDDVFDNTKANLWLDCVADVMPQAIVFYVHEHASIRNCPLYFKTYNSKCWLNTYVRTVCWFGIEFIKIHGNHVTLFCVDKSRIQFALPPKNLSFVNRLIARPNLRMVYQSTLSHFIDKNRLALMQNCAKHLKQYWPIYLINLNCIKVKLDTELNRSRSALEMVITKVVRIVIHDFTENIARMERVLTSYDMLSQPDWGCDQVVCAFVEMLNKYNLEVNKQSKVVHKLNASSIMSIVRYLLPSFGSR